MELKEAEEILGEKKTSELLKTMEMLDPTPKMLEETFKNVNADIKALHTYSNIPEAVLLKRLEAIKTVLNNRLKGRIQTLGCKSMRGDV